MRLFRIIVINLIIFLSLLVILEGVVRLVGGNRINFQGSSRTIFQNSVYYDTFGLKAGSHGTVFGVPVSINQVGLRGPEIRLDSTKSKILLIGDSVLFGVGIIDSQTTQYYLRKLTKDTVTFINTANIGYGLYDYFNVIRYWTKKIRPDSIFLFYVLNDLYSPSLDTNIQRNNWYEPLFHLLRTRSKLYLWFKNGLMNRGKSFFLYDYNLYVNKNRLYQSGCQQIAKIAHLCQELNIPLIVFILPYRYQYLQVVDEPWIPQKFITEKWKSYGIRVYDTHEIFAVHDINRYFLYGDPMHLSADGHFRLAQFVIQKL
jgi:lysophospholipase L1-like esterase